MYKHEDDFMMKQIEQLSKGIGAMLNKDSNKIDIELAEDSEGALLPVHDFLQQLIDKSEIQQAENFLASIKEKLTPREVEKLEKWFEAACFNAKYKL